MHLRWLLTMELRVEPENSRQVYRLWLLPLDSSDEAVPTSFLTVDELYATLMICWDERVRREFDAAQMPDQRLPND